MRWTGLAIAGGIVLAGMQGAAAQAQADPVADADPGAGTDPATDSGDIMVTARLRSENAAQVPIALSVIDAPLLDASYTVNTQQLSLLVPTLNYSSANPRNTAFTIRGLGSSVVAVSQANDGLEPGVGFYVDQVYHARPATAAFDFTDIERIEVLRGPQGTLFGKNSTAGAISITTAAPEFRRSGRFELSLGDLDLVQAKASVTGPLLGETVAFRLSGLVTRRDGFIRNVVSGIDHNGIGNHAVRGQLLFVPDPDLRIRLTADFTSFRSNCCTQVYWQVGTSLRAAARQYPALAAGQNYAPPSTDVYDRVTDIDAPLAVDTNEGGLSAIADWDVGPVTLTSISAWRFWNWDAANDRDYTGLAIQLVQRIPSRQDQYSQEVRVASNGDGPLSYVAGLYYFRQVITGRPISIYGPLAAYWLIGPTTGAAATPVPSNLLDGYALDGRTRFDTDSYAAFAELGWRLAGRLTLTGGLRYTYEDKSADYATSVSGGLATDSPALRNAQLSVLRPQSYATTSREDNVSGRAVLDWQANEALLLYASYARGFKSGGINVSGLPLDAQNQPALATAVIRPERNRTAEAGLKARLFDGRLSLDIAAYHTRVRDFQATIVDSSQTVALRGYLSNIPAVRVRGVEADAVVDAAAGLSLRASLAYADGRYSDYPAGPCPLERQTGATQACDLSGQRLAGLPRWAATLSFDYAHPLGGGNRLLLHADSSFRSGYNGDPSLSRFTYIDGYSVTNARIGISFGSGLELHLFARNLFAADYIQNVTIQAGNSGLILAQPSEPRVIGGTVGFRF
jgi:iron complex outermembrane receptor protein